MHLRTRIGAAALACAAAAISLTLASPAGADTAALPGDVVGVGSDTLQNGVDFVMDGAPGVAGGYNTLGNVNRVVSIDATGDASGRATYDSAAASLPGSVVLRAGTKPVQRPNGSGAGAAALNADASTGYQGLPTGSIDFARMSRLPNAGEEGNCPTSTATCGGLHVYQVATDNLAIAHQASAYNGPTGLSAAELVSIYQCTTTKWNQLPGNSSGSGDTIIPLIPQSGSGTRNFFLSDLQSANGGNAITLGGCVKTVQEHDPTGIASQATPADAIEPFSTGKIALLNSGYFANTVSTINGAPATNPAYAKGYLSVLSGTPGDSGTNYNVSRGLYITVRQVDVTSTTPFQPGSTDNWVQELITGSNSAFRSASGQAELAAAGFTPAFKDCSINPVSC